MIKTGFYSNISNEDYHNHPAISKSGLWEIIEKSPAHYQELKEHPPEPTPALYFGEALHLAVFQFDEYLLRYVVIPSDIDKRTNRGKAWHREHENGELISSDDDLKIREMVGRIHSHSTCVDLLADGEPELSGFWKDPVFGIQCKVRLDWLNKKERIIVDLKSTTDARFNLFRASAINYGYHMQSAFYLYGTSQITKVEHRDFYFIAIEKAPPYGIQVYKASEEMIQEGLIKCQQALEIYKDCLEKDMWPGYPETIEELDLPQWAKPKDNFIIE